MARTRPEIPPPAPIRPELAGPVFTVLRMPPGTFQAVIRHADRDEPVSEPTVFEALAWRYLAGAVGAWWDRVCRDRACK